MRLLKVRGREVKKEGSQNPKNKMIKKKGKNKDYLGLLELGEL